MVESSVWVMFLALRASWIEVVNWLVELSWVWNSVIVYLFDFSYKLSTV